MKAQANLEGQRNHLTNMIQVHRPQGSLSNKITVIFDGQADISHAQTSSVKTIFSHNESADDAIKKMVINSSNPKNIVVVTDDRDIQYSVRAQGAQVLPVTQFLSKLSPSAERNRTKKRKIKSTDTSKHISKHLEHKINSEFSEIWLKKKET